MEDISGYLVTSNAIIMEAYHVTSIAMEEMRRCQVTPCIVVEIQLYWDIQAFRTDNWCISNCVIPDGS